MDRVTLFCSAWALDEVLVASSPFERLMGLRGQRGRMLFRTRSVHSFGMDRPLRLVGLTRDMEVRVSRVLAPSRVAFLSGCRYVLELPMADLPPPVGARLEVRDA